MTTDNAESNLKSLFTWADATLDTDWHSLFEPLPFPGDVEAMTSLVKRYVKLRHGAEGFKAHRFDRCNHRAIAQADLLSLLGDAQRVDRGERNAISTTRTMGRPPKSAGTAAVCGSCGGIFTAIRSTATYCSEACKKKAQRARSVAGNVPVSERESSPVLG